MTMVLMIRSIQAATNDESSTKFEYLTVFDKSILNINNLNNIEDKTDFSPKKAEDLHFMIRFLYLAQSRVNAFQGLIWRYPRKALLACKSCDVNKYSIRY